jgi:HrpA-like RNA helicase
LNSILQLKALGIDNIKSFDYINDPGPQSLKNSLEYLCLLNLLSPESGNITALGKQVINCPLTDPLLSTMLLKSIDFECTEEALIIASMMSIGDFCLPGPSGKFEEVKNKFGINEGDVIAAVNIFQSFMNSRKSSSWCSSNFICYKNIMRAVTVQNRLSKYIKQLGFPIKSCGRDVNLVRKCVASVFFAQISKLSTDGVSYRSLRHPDESFPFYIHHSSCLFGRSPPWILPLKIQETSKPFLFNVTTIDPLWLPDLVPEAFSLGF